MSIATVTSKGQIAIPAHMRKRLGIKEGTRLYIEELCTPSHGRREEST